MVRLKQALVILVGLALAAGMVILGIWQLDVYRSQGTHTAAARAAEPPVDLATVAPPAAVVGDGFGRSVAFSGRYDRSLQLLVPVDGAAGSFRVLSGFRLASGGVVPVVRGVVHGTAAPAAPSGTLAQQGVLLPSEDNTAPGTSTDSNQLTAVRLPALAQRWPGALVGGFVTLPADTARAQGLDPAPVNLPPGQGRFRNGAYALQWWLFGAFALGMSIRISRDVGYLEEDLDSLEGPKGPDLNPPHPVGPGSGSGDAVTKTSVGQTGNRDDAA